ncbi:hypothetical protein ACJ41O_009999 [Fusarium nematophilum]
MKVSFAILALAGVGEATWGNWKDAKKYTPPRAIDNKCDDNQKGGWYWDDLSVGRFDKYNDWDFSGWTCDEDKSKRDLSGRTFGKSIWGECGSDKEAAPSFGCNSGSCGSNGYDKFSLKKFHVKPEFDCRLEFHYEMPDGSNCKHSADCSKDGTDVYNSQCGGAKKVRFVYPKQPNKPKDKCKVEIPKIDFDCDKPEKPSNTIPYGGGETTTFPGGEQTTTFPGSEETTTFPGGEETQTYPNGDETTTVPEGEETTTVPAGEETTSFPGAEETTSFPGSGETTTVPEGEETTTVPEGEETTTVPEGEETTTVPEGEETTSGQYPGETTSFPGSEGTTSVPEGEETTTVPEAGETTTVPEAGETTTVPEAGETTTVPEGEETKTVPTGEETTIITTYDSTSTIYTTEITTITSCAPEVPDCPATQGTPVVVTETIPLTTTVCPVTETRVETNPPAETEPATQPQGEEPTEPAGRETTATDELPGQTTSVPEGEEPTEPAGEETTATEPSGEETKTVPEGEEPTEPAGEETTGTAELPGQTTSVPEGEEPTEPAGEETTAVVTTTYDSTSTIYTTEVKTITSCGPEVPDCPATAGTPVVVTETVAVSTTVCPVTETLTNGKPSYTKPANGGDKTTEGSTPEETGSDESPEAPGDSYDVPEVVPSCLNTFLDYIEDCKDNTDAACYCPNKDFVDNVFECLYAHADNDDIVAEAVSFFQGICAPYAGENPGIATGADSITEHITVTGTTIITSAHYTTVVVATTVTEPCVTSGTTIEGSSTVRTISTEITVPEVGFTTGPSGNGPIPPPTATATVPESGSSELPQAPGAGETLITSKPVAGTGGVPVPTATAPGNVPVTAGAARTGMGFAAALLAAAIAL